MNLQLKVAVFLIGFIMVKSAPTTSPSEDKAKNAIVKVKEVKEKLDEENKTDVRGKEINKNAFQKNSDIVKALDADYAYDEEYEAPIIEIKFKREAERAERRLTKLFLRRFATLSKSKL